MKTVVPKDRGLAAAATRAEDGRAALMVAAFRTAGGTPLCIAVKGAERPTEVLLEDGASHRLSARGGWTFANGTLTLPATGRSAVWLITFGGYRARKLASRAPDPTASARRMDFIREDGKFNFAFVVDAKNRELTSAPLKKFCDACRFDSGEVPEVYGDNDNEKIAQMPWLVVFGDSDFARRRGVNAAELKEGEFVIRPIDRGMLVVGKDAAANQRALSDFSKLASRHHWKIP